ncbi:VanZ family protein [Paenibacillus sp. PR3]|uniref:VanZ family protein n=2 Tax=Paenibacillus terricola TaxID=2763503 RepID=A0ABR8MU62_9BACL|nr:VanZ family protein [Paenibacillus terricola]
MKLVVRSSLWILFIIYILVLVKYLVLDRMHFGGHYYRSYNLVPFSSIKQYINNREHYNYNTWFMNLMGNLVMLIPLGVLMPILFNTFRKLWNFIVVLITINLLIEIAQYYLYLGSADIDDVILNSFGATFAYIMTRAILKIRLLNKLLFTNMI